MSKKRCKPHSNRKFQKLLYRRHIKSRMIQQPPTVHAEQSRGPSMPTTQQDGVWLPVTAIAAMLLASSSVAADCWCSAPRPHMLVCIGGPITQTGVQLLQGDSQSAKVPHLTLQSFWSLILFFHQTFSSKRTTPYLQNDNRMISDHFKSFVQETNDYIQEIFVKNKQIPLYLLRSQE